MKEYMLFSNERLPDVENKLWAAFWEGTRKGEIRLPKCQNCNKFHFYPCWLCPFCHSPNISWHTLTSQPRLYTWTYVRRKLNPVIFKLRGPYNVALVEYDEAPGCHFMTNIVEYQVEELNIGMPLEPVFQQIDDKITMPLFRPVKDTQPWSDDTKMTERRN
jgi:uncharacterized protein